MKFFSDTAIVEDIRWGASLGIVDGVTTNPSLIARSGRKFEEVVKEITEIVDGPISAEAVSLEAEKMNVTLVFSANQALIAAKVGASYVSPFIGRIGKRFQNDTKCHSCESLSLQDGSRDRNPGI